MDHLALLLQRFREYNKRPLREKDPFEFERIVEALDMENQPAPIHQDQTTHHFMDQNMSWEVLIGSTNPAQQGAAPFSQFPSNQHGSAPLPPIDDAMMVELGLSGLDNTAPNVDESNRDLVASNAQPHQVTLGVSSHPDASLTGTPTTDNPSNLGFHSSNTSNSHGHHPTSFAGPAGGSSYSFMPGDNPPPLAGHAQPTYCAQPIQSHFRHDPPGAAESSIPVSSAPQTGSVGSMGAPHHQHAFDPSTTSVENANDYVTIEEAPTTAELEEVLFANSSLSKKAGARKRQIDAVALIDELNKDRCGLYWPPWEKDLLMEYIISPAFRDRLQIALSTARSPSQGTRVPSMWAALRTGVFLGSRSLRSLIVTFWALITAFGQLYKLVLDGGGAHANIEEICATITELAADARAAKTKIAGVDNVYAWEVEEWVRDPTTGWFVTLYSRLKEFPTFTRLTESHQSRAASPPAKPSPAKKQRVLADVEPPRHVPTQINTRVPLQSSSCSSVLSPPSTATTPLSAAVGPRSSRAPSLISHPAVSGYGPGVYRAPFSVPVARAPFSQAPAVAGPGPSSSAHRRTHNGKGGTKISSPLAQKEHLPPTTQGNEPGMALVVGAHLRPMDPQEERRNDSEVELTTAKTRFWNTESEMKSSQLYTEALSEVYALRSAEFREMVPRQQNEMRLKFEEMKQLYEKSSGKPGDPIYDLSVSFFTQYFTIDAVEKMCKDLIDGLTPIPPFLLTLHLPDEDRNGPNPGNINTR